MVIKSENNGINLIRDDNDGEISRVQSSQSQASNKRTTLSAINLQVLFIFLLFYF